MPFSFFITTKLIAILLFSIFIAACNNQGKDKTLILSGSTMGTTYSIQIVPSKNQKSFNKEILAKEISSILDEINNLMSTWQKDSEISQINNKPIGNWIPVSSDTLYVLELALEISKQSKGAFDVTVGSLVDLWGFGAAGVKRKIPDDAKIQQALLNSGYQNLIIDHKQKTLKKNTQFNLNLSAIAKGYAVDKIAKHLVKYKFYGYLVEIGGEIRAVGKKIDGSFWKIAIESPLTTSRQVHQVINITDRAIATSGDYRNYFEQNGQRYSHTINPITGKPITHKLASVTVVSDTAARADAIATALMVMGPENGIIFCEENSIAAYFIISQNTTFREQFSTAFEKYLILN